MDLLFLAGPTHYKVFLEHLVLRIKILALVHKTKHGIKRMSNVVLRVLFYFLNNTGVYILYRNVKHLRHTHTAIPEKHRTSVVLPNVFPKGSNLFVLLGPDGNKPYHFVVRQMRKGNVFILNNRRILQIGIDKILNFAVVKKVNPNNFIVLIFNPDYDIRIVFRIAVG